MQTDAGCRHFFQASAKQLHWFEKKAAVPLERFRFRLDKCLPMCGQQAIGFPVDFHDAQGLKQDPDVKQKLEGNR